MKSRLVSASIMLLISLLVILSVHAQPEVSDSKTLSPYFWVKSDDPGVEQLPLKSTGADVSIAGVIADVKVTQVYQNTGKQTIEAVYVFPASTRASVYGMKMTIGERTIIARIQEKEKARQEYEQAKQEGKSASLLEQQRPNVFQMNVANIMPGDLIRVELSYTELLIPTEGVYEFAYPTVVGPRYSNKPEAGAASSESWVKNPYLHQGEAPPYSFDITTRISAGIPIQEVTCPSHKVNVAYDGPAVADIKLDPTEKTGGNRDYILKYRLSGGQIQSGLMLYPGEKENFFLLMMQPPGKVSPAMIPAREYIFIVDISGSMHGFPLDISKNLLKSLIGGLKPTDTFNVLLFAGSSAMLSEKSMPADPVNIARAIQVIDHQSGGGGTELLPALKRALALAGDEKRSRTIVIATDGYVAVEKDAFQVIRDNLGRANMFAFGIGTSVNRFLIEGIARAGMGEAFIITSPTDAESKAEKFRKYIQSPVLTKVKTDFAGFQAYDVEPPALPDVLAERPVILFGKWKGEPKGTIRLSGISGDRPYSASIDAGSAKPTAANSAIRYLWARHRIAVLSDYQKLSSDDARVKEITRLGLEYNLLTEYTSFVAIDSLVRNVDGKSTTIQQPLPLPQGVSDLAVGASSTTRYAMSPAPASGRQMAKESLKFTETKAETLPEINIRVKHLAENMPISGSISPIVMEAFIAEHLKEIDSCHAAMTDGGKISVKMDIDGKGNMLNIQVGTDEIHNDVLKACILNLFKSWTLPAPSDGKPASIEIYLAFNK
jgi:Ca-activated chloride channel family protein